MIALAGKLIALWALIVAWRRRNDPPILYQFWGPSAVIEYDADLADLDAQIRRARREEYGPMLGGPLS